MSPRAALLVFSLLFLPDTLDSQVTRLADPINILAPTGYVRLGSSFLPTETFGVAGGTDESIGLINPATIREDQGIMVTAEASWRPGSDYLGLLHIDQFATVPRYLALSFPVSSLQLQVGYARSYEDRRESDPIPVTTSENPEGIGEWITFHSTAIVEGVFVAASNRITDDWTFGLGASVNVVKYTGTIFRGTESHSAEGLSFVAGVLYTPSPKLSVGVAATFHTSSNMTPDQPTQAYLRPMDSIRVPYATLVLPSYVAHAPERVTVGFSYAPLEQWRVLAGVEYVRWSAVQRDASDRYNVQVGFSWDPLEFLSVRGGVSSLAHQYDAYRDYFDQTEASIGLRLRATPRLGIALSWTSSEPFADEKVQTLLDRSGKGFYQTTISGGVKIGL